MLTGWFPLWTPTIDNRSIMSLGLLRAFPLVLLDGPTAIGRVEGVTIAVDRTHVDVMCTCTLDAVPADRYDGWYLAPDIDEPSRPVNLATSTSPVVYTVAGNLLGATLVPKPSWPNHRPVLISESRPI